MSQQCEDEKDCTCALSPGHLHLNCHPLLCNNHSQLQPKVDQNGLKLPKAKHVQKEMGNWNDVQQWGSLEDRVDDQDGERVLAVQERLAWEEAEFASEVPMPLCSMPFQSQFLVLAFHKYLAEVMGDDGKHTKDSSEQVECNLHLQDNSQIEQLAQTVQHCHIMTHSGNLLIKAGCNSSK